MDHLGEVTGAGGAGVQVALLCRTARLGLAFAAGSTIDRTNAGRQGLEDRVDVLHDVIGSADHHAIAAVDAPNSTAGADVDEVDSLLLELAGAADIVALEVRIATVDDDVARLHQGGQLHHGCFRGCARGEP